jgi:hypothetical protein
MDGKNHSTMKRKCFDKAGNFSNIFELSVHALHVQIFVDHFLIFDTTVAAVGHG